MNHDPRIDDFLDGRLSPPEEAQFVEELARNPNLRRLADHQRAIDASLRRIFSGPSPAASARVDQLLSASSTARQPLSLRLRRYAVAAILVLGAMGVIRTWQFVRPPAVNDGYALQPWRSFESVYHETIENGFKPSWVCKDEHQFRRAFERRFRQPLLLAALPSGVTAGGISYSNTLSPSTMNVLGKVDGTPIMIFVDKVQFDYGPPPPPPAGLHLFRRQIDDLVLYELTPFPEPKVLPYFYNPV